METHCCFIVLYFILTTDVIVVLLVLDGKPFFSFYLILILFYGVKLFRLFMRQMLLSLSCHIYLVTDVIVPDIQSLIIYCNYLILWALRKTHLTRSNINREEIQALAELKRDSSKVIIPADKGVALVVMDKPDCITKAQDLLEEKKTYKEIPTDPTNKLKTKLISLLKKIKADGGIEDQLYKKTYPTGAVAPKFYGLPKIHKGDIPLRPTVSSRGSISYEVAKEL